MKTILALILTLSTFAAIAQTFVGDYVAIIDPARCASLPKRQVAYMAVGADGWGTGEVLDFQGNHLAWFRAYIEGKKITGVSVTQQDGWDFTTEFTFSGRINLRSGVVRARADTKIAPGLFCRSSVTGWREAK